MTKHSSYIYSTYYPLINLPINELLQVGHNQVDNSNPIPSFDQDLLINLCSDAEKIFEKEDTVLNLDGDVFIVGDIHGSFHDLLRIINYIETIDPAKVLFLGDYVDRGEFSLECITLLFALKIEFPDRYFLIRGNHEFDLLCSQYGFKKEILNHHDPSRDEHPKSIFELPLSNQQNHVKMMYEEPTNLVPTEILCDKFFANHININCYKYSEKLYESFIQAFSYLPIATIINNTTFCIHGGLSPLFENVEKIERSIERPIHEYDTNPLLADLIWGDPSVSLKQTFEDNPRGCGKVFSGITVVQFLKNNNMNRIVRGHECVKSGIQTMFNDKCITVFSASSYNHEMGNLSGLLKIIQKGDRFETIRFDPIARLHKCDANYYRVQKLELASEKFPRLSANIENNELNRHSSMANFKVILRGRRISYNTGLQFNKVKRTSLAIPKPFPVQSQEVVRISKIGTSPIPKLGQLVRKKSSF